MTDEERAETLHNGICVECGKAFQYRLRGVPQITCSRECREQRKAKLGVVRMARYGLRHMAVGPLGYPERLACRSVAANASQGETCDDVATVLYLGPNGVGHRLCHRHETDVARAAAAQLGLVRVDLPSPTGAPA